MNAATGHVYVLAFSSGTVKVGRSMHGLRRLGNHKRDARKLGLTVTDEWLSPEHAEWLENEEALKRIARELGGTVTGNEYFTGIDFADVKARALSLTFTEPETLPEETAHPRQPTASASPECRCGGLGVEVNEWLAAMQVLLSPEGREQINLIRDLQDLAKDEHSEQGLTLNKLIANAFAALMTQVRNEAARKAQTIDSVTDRFYRQGRLST